jgi:hypothetical protein
MVAGADADARHQDAGRDVGRVDGVDVAGDRARQEPAPHRQLRDDGVAHRADVARAADVDAPDVGHGRAGRHGTERQHAHRRHERARHAEERIDRRHDRRRDAARPVGVELVANRQDPVRERARDRAVRGVHDAVVGAEHAGGTHERRRLDGRDRVAKSRIGWSNPRPPSVPAPALNGTIPRCVQMTASRNAPSCPSVPAQPFVIVVVIVRKGSPSATG